MKRIALPLLFLTAGYIGAKAQNTFPATGRTGIYTTTPAASFQVKGGARMGSLTNYTNIDSATGNLSFVGNALYQVGNNKFAFQSASQPLAGLFFNATNLRYEFRNTAGISVLNLGAGASNNFLGIGTTAPLTLLANTSSNIIGTEGIGMNPSSFTWATNAIGYSAGIANTNTSNSANGLAVKVASANARLLDLSVGSGNTPGTPIMRVESAGIVTIGNGNTDVQTLLLRGYGNNQAFWKGGAAFGYDQASVIMGELDSVATIGGHNANLSTWTNLAINPAGGNVGIGTNVPAARLDIAGNIKITDGTEGAGKLLTSDANGLASWTAAPASPFTISGNDIYNNNAGNLGIGTATPAAKLDVNGDALINGVTIGRGTGGVNDNTAIGKLGLYSNTTGFQNTANGYQALYSNTIGFQNTANGNQALFSNTSGVGNVANGIFSLYSNTTGFGNTANGIVALTSNTTGYNNTAIGGGSDITSGALYNATAIGANAKVDANNKVRIGSTDVTSIGGQVGWTTFSDGRYKQNIKKDVHGLDFINSLNPVTYTVDIKGLNNYFDKNRKKDSLYDKMKKDMQPSADAASKIVYNGFVAQEVEAAAKKLNYDFSGVDKPKSKDGLYGLRYSDFVVPLVKAVQELSSQNEQLKTENEAQQKVNADLQKQIDDLKAMITKGNAASQSEVSNNQTAAESNTTSLKQNAPNPFSVSTVINFSLPKQYTNAQILITDMTGKTIKQANVSGSNSLTVAAGSLASGSYKYSLVIDGKIMGTKTMVLTR